MSRAVNQDWMGKSRALSFLVFVSLLFIGGDLVAINISSFTFRAVNIPILLVFVAIGIAGLVSDRKFDFDFKYLFVFSLLSVAAVLSIPNSWDAIRSVAYSFWLVFNFFVLVPVFYCFARNSKPQVVSGLLFIAYRLQVLLLLLEVIYLVGAGEEVRPHLWFYEPSYAAIYFTSYFAFSLMLVLAGGFGKKLDLILSLIGLLVLSSATAMFGVIIVVVVSCVIQKKYLTLSVFCFVLVLFAGLMTFVFGETKYFQLVMGYMVGHDGLSDLIFSILSRTGTRVIRFLMGVEAFLNNMAFGIGIGASEMYTKINAIPLYAERFVVPWESAHGAPFVNPLVEIAATMGLVGLIAFVFIFLFGVAPAFVRTTTEQGVHAKSLGFAYLCMFAALQFEGTFLRNYIWAIYGLALGSYARYRSLEH